MSEPRVILELSRDRMIGALVRAGVPASAVFLADEFYALPTWQWVTADFAREWSSIIQQLGFKYADEVRDCDDFARAAAHWAGEFHARTPGAPESGLAFGEAWCHTRSHAFNVCIHTFGEGNYARVQAYEPQPAAGGFTMTVLKLEPEDWASIYLCKF